MTNWIKTTLLSSLLLLLLTIPTNATLFQIRNECSYPVWAAASPGGGRRLNRGEEWQLNVPAGTATARIWGRTNCKFDKSGRGHCQTGDCGGVLNCFSWGHPPNTVAEYSLNQYGNLDFYDVSLLDGFNIPMEFSPIGGAGSTKCRNIKCTADINGQCPIELKASSGGCNNPCTVFNTNEYCCTEEESNCGPTNYSEFFKTKCPDAFSYPRDEPTSTFTCPSGITDYRVVFCPPGTSPHLEMVVGSE